MVSMRLQARSRLVGADQFQERRELGPVLAAGERDPQRHIQLRPLASAALLENLRQALEVGARLRERLERRHEEARSRRIEHALLIVTERRQLAVHDRRPRRRIRWQHDVVPDELQEITRVARAEPRAHLLRAHALHGLALPVHELRLLEAGRGAPEVLGAKMRRHLLAGEPSIDVARMTEAQQMIEQCFGQEAALAKIPYARAAMALRQRCAVLPDQQPDVPIARDAQPERGKQQHLARRIGEMIVPAQHVGYTHQRIVDGVREEESRGAVLPSDDEVPDLRRREYLRSVHEVHPLERRCRGHGEAQGGLEAACLALGALRGAQVAAGSGVARRLARHALKLARQLELLRRAVARVRPPLTFQLLEVAAIDIGALRLQVRPVRASNARTLVPLKTEPVEVLDELVEEAPGAALDIGILDAQNEAPAAAASPQPVEKSRARIAEMQ